ncbi:putative actin-related protein [Phaeomoniella chlamydospora]|uniref:Putative actin-related protein n=1 Tax=Phaeomoniella chlamydospora TaxID=158046 RepID=A0A0G2E674_PHACM|nr:putative actin-related protein [Phaeomoniella chlamydospora]
MPHPTLSSLLHLVFTRWNFASVGLLPSPTTITLAAGLRCALVVDIGWAETTVTAVYEYRETNTQRSTRAMKQTVREMAKVLYPPAKDDEITAKATDEHVNFDFAEEVIVRLGWCRTIIGEPSSEALGTEQTVQIEMPSGSQLPVLETTRRALSQPVETALFASGFSRQDLDDEELPLPQLVFRALTVLPPDVRGICMSRIIFTGGGSNIPGLSKRVLDEVATLMSSYGWNNVRGKVIDKERDRLKEISANKPVRASAGNTTPSNAERSEIDPIEEKLRRIHLKESKPPVQGILREVKSLGAWAGASLLSGMKVRGLVEVERERFLQHGLAGAHKEGEVSTVPTRQSFGPGLAKAAGDRSSWTLAGWG